MDFEELEPRTPKGAAAVERNLADCARRKRIQPATKEDARTFLAKAFYHLQAAEHFQAENFGDWAVIAYYAAMYMAAKAFTSHFLDQAAKDHGCTIALMLEAIHGKKLAGQLKSARKSFEKEVELLSLVRQYRNTVLYTVTAVSDAKLGKIGKTASAFVETVDSLVKQ